MQAFHKLAGVQEASDAGAQPAAPVPARTNKEPPRPPPIPQDEVGDVDANSNRSSAKRASIPLNRRPSQKSMRSHRSKKSFASQRSTLQHEIPIAVDLSAYPPSPRPNQRFDQSIAGTQNHVPPRASIGSRNDGQDAGDVDDLSEEFQWGPSHPCFPHPNPHSAPDSEERATTRVIRVKRDWLAAGDLYPQYANLYPEILDPLVVDSEFRSLVTSINTILQNALSPYTTRAWVDSILGVVTGYFWEDMGWTGAKKGGKELQRFLDGWNMDREREERDVRVVQLRKTGFMSLDFVIPDPGIDQPNDQSGGEEEEEDVQGDGQDMGDALRDGGGGIGPAE
ncbi:hypothetical protein CLAFUW4_07073 [Fulvia fulva]|uniref:Ras modification protein ERF4 n=1 Tax=Passalora fulva TaxID=5499 RepID=A0A9Q8UR02_PASFU|nr:uncharacterized protein CLAFUR5_07209 [Fulvia fulva]KAK4621929.1 hypothetical protein CLAFUR4_07082 [Fulvia fulva]KAK4622368.1 hypothetical protein CLAFUR0_07080 [Fulvia fulva]UJO19211.1 hypothetical protein CLAFUR5_07209 [Fulvia fulva]WPV16493.1 hypothetical protein CLAFUW4_07073 [Fulvia fulva]WPV31418.1 hypothetical protein CLAFUW7_07073 [Fulvia fulva]